MSMPFESAVSDTNKIVSKSAEPNPETDHGESCAKDARFFEQYAPDATRYAMSIVRRWADAEEITQEAFCKLIQNETMATVESESALKAVLFTTVRNLSIDRLRRQGRRQFEVFDEQALSADSKLDSGAKLHQLENGINTAMNDLPGEWSEALQLKVNGGLSYAEIANVMSATQNQIRTWIFRARKQLQAELKQSGLLED
jgi:RNA polymerase sigma-70 factor (ECF subfamily)